MTPGELLESVRAQCMSLEVVGGRLRVAGLVSVITPELCDQLQKREGDVLRLLQSGASAHPPEEHATAQHLPIRADHADKVSAAFIAHGTVPDDDELAAAIHMEMEIETRRALLDGLYGGDVTIFYSSRHGLAVLPKPKVMS